MSFLLEGRGDSPLPCRLPNVTLSRSLTCDYLSRKPWLFKGSNNSNLLTALWFCVRIYVNDSALIVAILPSIMQLKRHNIHI